MKAKILGLLAAGLLTGPFSADAVVRTYDFTVNGGSVGSLANVTSSGYFSFDDAIIPAGGGLLTQAGMLTDLSFIWNGIAYDEATANTGFMNFDAAGNLVPNFAFGTDCAPGVCVVTASIEGWVITGFPGSNLFIYATPLGRSDTFTGSFIMTLRGETVSEPGTLALLGLGLAGLGVTRRRRAN